MPSESMDERFVRGLVEQVELRGMTYKRLALESGLSETTIHNWKRGTQGVTLYSLRSVKSALGCTWNELLGP